MIDMNAIRAKTHAVLKAWNVPAHPYLPVLGPISIHSASEIATKAIVLYAMAGLANNADPQLLRKWLIENQMWTHFTEDQQAFLHGHTLTEEETNELSWKVESLYTLCWIGLIATELPFPDKPAPLKGIFPNIPPEIDCAEFVSSFKRRNDEPIVEQLDIYYSLHASLKHPELWGKGSRSNLPKIEIVTERRHALEWVCGGNVDWDDVVMDT